MKPRRPALTILHAGDRASGRRGYTLFELILVLLLVVAAAGLTVPVIQTMLADTRMIAAGDIVRSRLADARAMAMEEGRAYRFGFMPNTGKIQIAPDDDPVWDGTGMGGGAEIIQDELPDNVIFMLAENSQEGGAWATGAVYLPDGSARDDAIVFYGKEGQQPGRAEIRGLTGAARIIDRPQTQVQP